MKSYCASGPAYQHNKVAWKKPLPSGNATTADGMAFILMVLAPDAGRPNFLHFGGSNAQIKTAGSELNSTGWFTKSVSFKRFFNKDNIDPVMHCKSFRMGHVALFFHLLHEAGLLHTDSGNCYMKEAAKLILSNGRKVNERYLSKLSSCILAHPVQNAQIIARVKAIISAIVDAGK